jgi:hypothetical protein
MNPRFVRNTRVPAWGLGRVLSTRGDQLDVYFEHGGLRKLSTRVAVLQDVPESEIPSDSPVLDPDFGTGKPKRSASPARTGSATRAPRGAESARPRAAADPGVRTRSSEGTVRNPASPATKRRVAAEPTERFTGGRRIPVLVEKFRARFPRGMSDPLVDLEERTSLRAVAEEFRQKVQAQHLSAALDAGSCEDIIDLVTDLLERSALLSPIDLTRLKAMPTEAEVPFVQSLWEMLRAESEMPDAIEQAADRLMPFELGRWGVLTALALLIGPERWCIVRPETLPRVADMLAFDLAWETRPNAYTCRRAQLLASGLRSELNGRGETIADQIDLAIFLKYAAA